MGFDRIAEDILQVIDELAVKKRQVQISRPTKLDGAERMLRKTNARLLSCANNDKLFSSYSIEQKSNDQDVNEADDAPHQES
jgi:hypothetical protein